MKKLIVLISIFFLFINSSFAQEFKKIPENFKENCYEFFWILKQEKWTLKINSTKKIDTFISDNKIIPHKLYKNYWWILDFKIKNLFWNLEYLSDENYKTFLIYDEEKNKNSIFLEFDKILKAWSFDFNFEYKANYRNAHIEISKDWEKYFFVPEKKLNTYDFKFLKISFNTTVKHITPPEKIKIFELKFISKNYIYLVKTIWEIKAYAKNICKNNYINLKNNYWEYNLNKNTKTIFLELKENPNFNPNKVEDFDLDKIPDSEDNCPKIANPKQFDKNADWIGDLCSDDDWDSIIWKKDNCINVYNPKQEDINRNWVWDKCEFDKDSDWIFDQLDNCINIANPLQKDDDLDNIWNKCDNSIYYNPRQLDKNNNWIGDVTEEKEKFLKENDKDWDKIINSQDNCEEMANPKQEDFDKDGIWDVCDNCKNIQNSDQLDENKNWVWDICEDSDSDWISWIKDNCINIYNPLQKDSDNNGIWDACEDSDLDKILAKNDNCPYDYNPLQSDIDLDWIWDVCDKKDDRFFESNKNIFMILLSLVIVFFWIAIFKMAVKLK